MRRNKLGFNGIPTNNLSDTGAVLFHQQTLHYQGNGKTPYAVPIAKHLVLHGKVHYLGNTNIILLAADK